MNRPVPHPASSLRTAGAPAGADRHTRMCRLLTTCCGVALTAPMGLAQALPQFTHPTAITNPFYPVAQTKHSVTLGVDSGDAFRTEVTLLPTTLLIHWAGGVTRTRISQYSAYRNGDLIEVAYDFFAQADNGDLYYFGEDVFNYEDGVVANTHGTWRAAVGGAPPGLIMPAHPTVGMVFHPENFLPLVWEEDTVVSLTEPTQTPLGPISNGLLIHELLLDNTEELKVYAHGFGQVELREADAASHMALLNRTNAPNRQVPFALRVIESRSAAALDAAPHWWQVHANVMAITWAWSVYRNPAIQAGAPPEFVASMAQEVIHLVAAAQAHDLDETQEAASDLRRAAIDMFRVYNPRVPVDIKRIAHLEREVMLDAQAGDWTEVAVLNANAQAVTWARLRPFVLQRPGGASRAAEVDEAFADLLEAIDEEDAEDAIEAAEDVIEAVEDLVVLF